MVVRSVSWFTDRRPYDRPLSGKDWFREVVQDVFTARVSIYGP